MRGLEDAAVDKRDQLQHFLWERFGDAELLALDDAVVDALAVGPGKRASQKQQTRLHRIADRTQSAYQYSRVLVLDRELKPLNGLPGESLPAAVHSAAQQALLHGTAELVNVHHAAGGRLVFGIVRPVFRPQDTRQEELGVVYLEDDLEKHLYPIISRWPMQGATAESYLIRREGTDAVLLSPFRNFPSARPLEFSRPIKGLFIEKAIESGAKSPQTYDGQDYRGKYVVGSVTPIDGTDWYLVVKEDHDELHAPQRVFVMVVLGIGGLMGLLLLIAGWLVWKIQQSEARQHDLAKMGEQLRTFIDEAPVALAMLDRDMRYLAANSYWRELIGLGDEELVGRRPSEVQRGIPQHRLEGAERALSGEKVHSDEDLLKRTDSSAVWIRWEACPWHTPQGAIGGIVIFALNIDLQKKAEDKLRVAQEQLFQAQKMEAVGQLAGGVAHDFNNSLTIIQGFAERLRERLRGDALGLRAVEQILQAQQRSASLTRQLLHFSDKQYHRSELLDLNDEVHKIEETVRQTLGAAIELSLEYGDELPNVKEDAGLLQQVLINLVTNARDAMGMGGRLTIRTALAKVGAKGLEQHPLWKAGEFVTLSVADTGCGMDAALQGHIFEPFFTTKPIGQGAGLGLSTAYAIVQRKGGFIEVESEPGKGSCFTVYLPAMAEKMRRHAPETPPEPANGGKARIMLVEDEAALRELMADSLRAKGHTVLDAETAATALEMAEKETGEIAVLVTDVILSGMSGPEIARQMLVRYPSMKVIFISGYTDEYISKYSQLDAGATLLEKPFSTSVLVRAVQAALESELTDAEKSAQA